MFGEILKATGAMLTLVGWMFLMIPLAWIIERSERKARARRNHPAYRGKKR